MMRTLALCTSLAVAAFGCSSKKQKSDDAAISAVAEAAPDAAGMTATPVDASPVDGSPAAAAASRCGLPSASL